MLQGGSSLVSTTRSRNISRRQNHRMRRVLLAAMSLDAGGVSWQAVERGNLNEGGEGDVSEPLSCLFIGPIEEADRVHLEALYMQARDSYYSGRPLILDEMFDKVETRLRNLRSKMVLKYPRCSLKKFAAYSDAEEDTSQMSTLMAVWGALGLAGAFAAVVPPLCTATSVCDRLVNEALEPWWAAQSSPLANFLLALGLLGGVPLASAAVQQVKSLLRGEVVALKGCCPNCGEEVYAFLDAKEHKPRHKSECHVCEHPLVFHATVETSKKDGKQWAYGRVYLVTRSKDLEPQKKDRSLR
ncbi:hypothetical protein KFL_000200010 [Klebsormidium nitens]|uniref:Uncharacterized protein n=1 Tax=Klebsormidium nitens TaxID=105231 RepID=A0A1Y1HNU0_KLENI|nr:hypothetical protein KFL_000200010 [Klebsormidium nitens]|eukprot:GAQ78849.1 hypothetical protein KFL_000200010 [Klebsormidium nitens]